MSTRGVIARQINHREVEYLYSHWDNHLEYNGVILQEHYNTRAKVDELFAKNRGISSLAESVEKTNFYEEEGEAIKKCPINFLNTRADGCWAEFVYVFTLKGEWKYREIWSFPKGNGEWALGWSRFKSLAKAVEKINNPMSYTLKKYPMKSTKSSLNSNYRGCPYILKC